MDPGVSDQRAGSRRMKETEKEISKEK